MRRRFKYFEYQKLNKYIKSNHIFYNIYLRYVFTNFLVPFPYRQLIIIYFLKNKFFFSKLNYVCLETGKTRSVLMNFKVSRLTFKILVGSAFINGVYKFNW